MPAGPTPKFFVTELARIEREMKRGAAAMREQFRLGKIREYNEYVATLGHITHLLRIRRGEQALFKAARARTRQLERRQRQQQVQAVAKAKAFAKAKAKEHAIPICNYAATNN